MPITSEDLLNFAVETLREGMDTEVEFRTVANRAYYAAFLKARHVSKTKNKGGGVHDDAIKYFSSRNLKVYNRLISLKEARTRADYHPQEDFTRRDAGACLNKAGYVLDNI